jgi:hypothetical protein
MVSGALHPLMERQANGPDLKLAMAFTATETGFRLG